MSNTEILVPEGMAQQDTEIVLANWLVDEGEYVDEGDPICELMVTKVTIEVAAPTAGRLEQRASVEDVVTIGALLGVISAA
jgi:pyruvate/2-oxoglutarate dehydrogenase complex dihydrolipoamide acyltransferase (E2) component